MKKIKFNLIFFTGLIFLLNVSEYTYSSDNHEKDSVKSAPDNWYILDLKSDNYRGISLQQTYDELLKSKKSQPVVVAVVDGGVDIEHEDLKSNIWINEAEIAGNGVDDDKNGFIDDINGWNFIGGKNGEDINYDSFELTRQYASLKKKFDGRRRFSVKKNEKRDYRLYKSLSKEYVQKLKETTDEFSNIKGFYEMYLESKSMMKNYLKKDTFTIAEFEKIKTDNPSILRAMRILIFANDRELTESKLEEAYKEYEGRIKYNYNLNYDPRPLVGDNYSDLTERIYGNNDVAGPDPTHGTHVAGIIGANRNNQIGMQGIADNVKIMVVRVIPDGDERDKDIANAIYYAVNNGAKIINMSFGKFYSPDKKVVDDAFKYADSKGVLMIHAAGNESDNSDKIDHYPTRKLLDKKSEISNWIEVGASSWGENQNFVGKFSNYGKITVDIFAPGVDIYSTIPKNKYDKKDGTSMACPVVTGIAALLLSYFPQLTASQLKEIIINSSYNYKDLEVNKPVKEGKKQKTVKFGKLSKTGGIVNAYQAVNYALKISK